MTEYKLKYWHKIRDYMSNDKNYPSISLLHKDYFSISCKIIPNRVITFSTHEGGGHGEGSWDDEGRTGQDWINLIKEAESVANHYWGKVE